MLFQNRNGLLPHSPARRIRPAYTIIASAKSIYTGSGQITDADLANPEIVGIEAFTLITHALLIVRYGLDALKITAKKADPSVFT